MTMPTDQEATQGLLPCPFCGGKAQMRLDHDHSTAWIVECMTKPSCPIHDREIYGLTKDAAFIAWNRRAALPHAGERIAALEVENARLREVLESIAENPGHTADDAAWRRIEEARTALAGEQG